ncbi:MAG: radical SAM family heme chaperone HemW [Actinomycetota bacterium]
MGFGVYVHIPFCTHRCDYCDFATWTDRAHLVDAYVDACVRDLGRRREPDLPLADSVFFGGGTPSLLTGEQLARILAAVPRASVCEVTVECNPDSVDPTKFEAYAGAGVNRISLGAQSFVPHVLAALGRTHDPANVERAVAAARAAGIERVNLDLIYGTPAERPEDWRASLAGVVDLGVGHVSAYALTVEAGTPLGRDVAAGIRPAPDDDEQADAYEVADTALTAAGYEWYEVSNWARPGEECRHNLCYWEQGDYLAIGCAAHGHTAGTRWWNVRTPERYIDAITTGADPGAGHEVLDPVQRSEERLTLALRTRAGARCARAASGEVVALAEQGLLTRSGDRVVLTRRGRMLASEVTARLLAAGAATGGATEERPDPVGSIGGP